MFYKSVAVLITLAICVWLPVNVAQAQQLINASLPQVVDLRQESQLATSRKLPLLLLFTTEHCEFCELIKHEYLLPMQQDPAYARRVIIREVPADGIHYLRDFDGKLIAGDDLALRYAADLIPTIVFIDANGRVLAEPLVGITSRHHYDQYLEERITQALRTLHAGG